MKRRDFLKVAAATTATTLSGCAEQPVKETVVPKVKPEQAAKKYQGRSRVALMPCASYDEDITALLSDYAKKLSLPSIKGKKVVLKPNMVEYREGNPVTTNPAVLSAVIKFAKQQGASEVIVAEGPGHMRDTEFLLKSTGLGKACADNDVRFVDLNLDDIVPVENDHGFSGLKPFFLPRTIVEADAVISIPKLKTHHWVGVTCSMKNLFGTVPGRKYGWPKNLLHIKGIPNCIIDLVHLVHPVYAIVDAVVAMEGDGPINGKGIETHFLAMGADLAAVDATCIRTTSLKPEQFAYMLLAGLTVGNIEADKIDVIGSTIEELRKEFDPPITIKNKELLAHADQEGS